MSTVMYQSVPTAPPGGAFDVVPGYEGTVPGGAGGFLPPPMPSIPTPMPENGPAHTNWNIFNITQEAATEAFANYVSENCCYSKAPVREGIITSMEPFNTYRYRLETFAETRSTEWSHEPFTGQRVDVGLQVAPGPWDIATQTPGFFQDNTQTIRVPFTSSVKNCHVCLGVGTSACKDCTASGTKVCYMCSGSGARAGNDRCLHCNGSGREKCRKCNGRGNCDCETCRGKKQLLVFISLKVQWITYKDDFVKEQSSGLPSENLNKVSGKEIFKDAQYMLYPLMNFPDSAMSQASDRLVREHQSKYFQTSRILQQRHMIELIPITRVSYTWKGKGHTYSVYGNESRVFTDSYPAQCCCSCM
ncbi:protein SSUH2 homolog isoform X2 [Trichomycterus rosablanca]